MVHSNPVKPFRTMNSGSSDNDKPESLVVTPATGPEDGSTWQEKKRQDKYLVYLSSKLSES